MIVFLVRKLRRIRFQVFRLLLALTHPLVRISPDALMGRGTFFGRGRQVEIGKRFFCGRNCHFSAPAMIGDDVMFASQVALVGGDHKIDFVSGPMNSSGRDEMRTIVIEDDVWVGYGAIIMHGVHLGAGSVIAAGSVVTRDVPPSTIVAGNPAKPVRRRKKSPK